MTDCLFKCSKAELGQKFSYFLRYVFHEIHHVVSLTFEFFSQLRILGGNTNWASIAVAHPHHYATHYNQWSCSETKFFCAEKGSDNDITPSL